MSLVHISFTAVVLRQDCVKKPDKVKEIESPALIHSTSGFIISNWVNLAHFAFGKFSLPFAKVFLSFMFLEMELRRCCSIFFPRLGIKLSCNSLELPSCFFLSSQCLFGLVVYLLLM